MGPSPLSTLQFLALALRSLVVAIMAEKQKITFFLDNGAVSLSYHSLLVPSDKVIIWGIFGKPLEHYFTQPLTCSWGDLLFCHSPHSTWKSSVPAEMGFTISIKSSNSPPPRQLFLLPPPSGTNRSHSVDWWDECRVSQDDPPYSNKTQKYLTFSTPKTISPQAWGMMRPYVYHKFLKTTRATN
jgi:hypothetical protein